MRTRTLSIAVAIAGLLLMLGIVGVALYVGAQSAAQNNRAGQTTEEPARPEKKPPLN
jgi:flagellar basal body-associated protein FliL